MKINTPQKSCVCVTARRCQTSRNIARLRGELRQIVPRRIHFTASPPRRRWRLLLGHRRRRSCGQTCPSVALAVHCQTRPALTECGNKGKRRALNVMTGVMCPPARAADAAAQCAPLSLLRCFSHRRRFAIRRLFLADGRDSASRRRHRVPVPCWSVTGEQRSGPRTKTRRENWPSRWLHEATCFVRRRGGQQLGGGQQAAHFGIIRHKSSRRRPRHTSKIV